MSETREDRVGLLRQALIGDLTVREQPHLGRGIRMYAYVGVSGNVYQSYLGRGPAREVAQEVRLLVLRAVKGETALLAEEYGKPGAMANAEAAAFMARQALGEETEPQRRLDRLKQDLSDRYPHITPMRTEKP